MVVHTVLFCGEEKKEQPLHFHHMSVADITTNGNHSEAVHAEREAHVRCVRITNYVVSSSNAFTISLSFHYYTFTLLCTLELTNTPSERQLAGKNRVTEWAWLGQKGQGQLTEEPVDGL